MALMALTVSGKGVRSFDEGEDLAPTASVLESPALPA